MDQGSAAPVVPCPVCRQPALYAPTNRWRPFCGERCHGLDLGAWASEDYRVDASQDRPSHDEMAPSALLKRDDSTL